MKVKYFVIKTIFKIECTQKSILSPAYQFPWVYTHQFLLSPFLSLPYHTHPINSLSVQVWRVPHLLLFQSNIQGLSDYPNSSNVLTQGLLLSSSTAYSFPSQRKIRLFINFCNNQNSKESFLKAKIWSDFQLLFFYWAFFLLDKVKVEHKITEYMER